MHGLNTTAMYSDGGVARWKVLPIRVEIHAQGIPSPP